MIGVVADDITGANDIGIMFRNNQYSVKVMTYQEGMCLENDVDVLIIDTDSRLDQPELSYKKVFGATRLLMQQGCSLYFNKTCSVFRGNIGKEFDAMLDALQENFAVISLAFPKMGRTTINGIHKVYGKLLENSEFAKDPVHPMTKSDLVAILQEQTLRKVSLVTIEDVRQGPLFLRQDIEKKKETSNYCIVDTESQDDLSVVAEAVHDYPVICGSSAIAEELPRFLSIEKKADALTKADINDKNGVLVISGSLTPQTRAQTDYLCSVGIDKIVLDSRKIFASSEFFAEMARIVDAAKYLLLKGKDVLVMADNSDNIVLETKIIGENLNIDSLTVSKWVSAALADITKILVKETGLKRLVVAGGDTSGTVCRKLGIQGNYILQEIETGLPAGLTLNRNMLIVLKSGSFGRDDVLLRAIKHLKDISNS